jgi:hypothetical protein
MDPPSRADIIRRLWPPVIPPPTDSTPSGLSGFVDAPQPSNLIPADPFLAGVVPSAGYPKLMEHDGQDVSEPHVLSTNPQVEPIVSAPSISAIRVRNNTVTTSQLKKGYPLHPQRTSFVGRRKRGPNRHNPVAGNNGTGRVGKLRCGQCRKWKRKV